MGEVIEVLPLNPSKAQKIVYSIYGLSNYVLTVLIRIDELAK